jgi:tetratricopeptide (TPR) repeat protein
LPKDGLKSSEVDKLTPDGYAMIYSHIGDVYLELGDFEKALKNYFLSQKYSDSPLTNILISLVYQRKNDFDNANKYLNQMPFDDLTCPGMDSNME